MSTHTLTSTQALSIGDAMRSRALSYARKTGPAIDMVVIAAANAKHEFSLTPIKLMNAIKENLSAEEIAELPQPGSKWNDRFPVLNDDGTQAKDDKGNLLFNYNNNPDICQWKDPSKPDGKPKEISFYIVWADGTPEGAHVVKELDWCKCVSTEGMKTDHIPAEWIKKYSNPQLIKKRKAYLENRRGTVRKAYKDAIRLLWQIDMVNELSGCGAELGEDADDNTVIVFNKLKPRAEWKPYSVGAFLKLNPLKASETDGSYAALEATAKRTKPPAGGGTAEKNKTGVASLALNSVQTPESSDKVAVVWHSYLHEAMNDRKGDKYAALVRHLTSDAGKQSVLTMGGIRDALNGLFMMDQIKAIYDTEKEKLNKAAA